MFHWFLKSFSTKMFSADETHSPTLAARTRASHQAKNCSLVVSGHCDVYVKAPRQFLWLNSPETLPGGDNATSA